MKWSIYQRYFSCRQNKDLHNPPEFLRMAPGLVYKVGWRPRLESTGHSSCQNLQATGKATFFCSAGIIVQKWRKDCCCCGRLLVGELWFTASRFRLCPVGKAQQEEVIQRCRISLEVLLLERDIVLQMKMQKLACCKCKVCVLMAPYDLQFFRPEISNMHFL